MNIYICDDETGAREVIRRIVCQFFDNCPSFQPQIILCDSGDALLSHPERKDLVFLDIEMPGFNGIDVTSQLKLQNPSCIIIIVTSHDQYLDDAMSFEVFRYISKPVRPDRILRNLNDALQKYMLLETELQIRMKNSTFFVKTSDIRIIEATHHGSLIITNDQKPLMTGYTLNDWMALLPPSAFFRSHRSYIVNLKYIQSYTQRSISLKGTDYKAVLTPKNRVPFENALLTYKALHH